MSQADPSSGTNASPDHIAVDVGAGAKNTNIGHHNTQTNIEGNQIYIHQIILLGEFLSLAQVEGLLPNLKQQVEFGSISEAIEGEIQNRLGNDLAEAVAFAGEILGEFLPRYLPQGSKGVVQLAKMLNDLLRHLHKKLQVTGHWKAFSQLIKGAGSIPAKPDRFFPLELTSELWKKHFGHAVKFGICEYAYGTGDVQYAVMVGNRIHSDVDPEELDTKELRIFIAGIVLDLIRISSQNSATTQFLVRQIDLLNSHSKRA